MHFAIASPSVNAPAAAFVMAFCASSRGSIALFGELSLHVRAKDELLLAIAAHALFVLIGQYLHSWLPFLYDYLRGLEAIELAGPKISVNNQVSAKPV